MGSIQVQNVTKQFGSLTVLDGVSVEFHSGRITGIVGPNGAGKTTLFRMMTGQLDPDLGTVTKSRDIRVGYLTQEPNLRSDATLHDEVASVFDGLLAIERRMHVVSDKIAERHAHPDLPDLMSQYDRLNAEFESAGGYAHEQRMEEVLGGLGFSQSDRGLPISVLSGGQKCRVALAKLLLQDHSMLLLDEPTNHLDIDAVRWLERFLAGHRGGAVIISHDRYLMDRVADRMIEVAATRIHSYPGNYSNYVESKARNRLSAERQYEKDREFVAKERAFIAKHLAGQRTKEAQGRRSRLERRIRDGEFVLELESKSRNVRFDFSESGVLSGEVLRTVDLSKTYDDKPLFGGLGFQIEAGQRLGITGPNGTGKTTLLRILEGVVESDTGEFEWSPRVSVGYFSQDAKELTGTRTLLDELRSFCPEMDEAEARSHLGRFHFTGADVFKPVGVLSGGEQSRLRLIKLLKTAPNVLVLDEPTNHLDIPSREALEGALADFPGTIIAVSHDRFFLDRLATRLLVIRPDRHRMIRGNYSDYAAIVEKEGTGANRSVASGAADSNRSEPGKKANASTKSKSSTTKYDSMSVEQIEVLVMDCERRLAAANERFTAPDVYRDPQKLSALQDAISSVRDELSELETVWSERAEQC